MDQKGWARAVEPTVTRPSH